MYFEKPSRINNFLVYLLNSFSIIFKTFSFINLSLKKLQRKVFSDLFVVSIDNLSFGGTGKTSLVIALADFLIKKGRKFAIISRGYRSQFEKAGVKLTIDHSSREIGDEARLLIHRFPNTDIYIGKDRIKSILQARENGNRIIILDDGFQSTHIHKNFKILLLNPKHPYYYLRNFKFMKNQADFLLYYSKPPFPQANGNIEGTYYFELDNIFDKNNNPISVKNQSLLGFSALGDNLRFKKDLEVFNLQHFVHFNDHHIYKPEEVAAINKLRIEKNINFLICTEKDFIKISELNIKDIPLIYTRNSIKFDLNIFSDLVDHAEKKSETKTLS